MRALRIGTSGCTNSRSHHQGKEPRGFRQARKALHPRQEQFALRPGANSAHPCFQLCVLRDEYVAHVSINLPAGVCKESAQLPDSTRKVRGLHPLRQKLPVNAITAPLSSRIHQPCNLHQVRRLYGKM
jgi:hypothetical protein